jgi:hypothetical protein
MCGVDRGSDEAREGGMTQTVQTRIEVDEQRVERLARAAHQDRPPLQGKWMPWSEMSFGRRNEWLDWARRIERSMVGLGEQD